MRDANEIVHRHNQLVAIAKGDLQPGPLPFDEPSSMLWLKTAVDVLAWVSGAGHQDNFAQQLAMIDEYTAPPGEVLLLDANGRRVRSAQPVICQVCGCSEFEACRTADGACYWAEPGLCSACAGKGDLLNGPIQGYWEVRDI